MTKHLAAHDVDIAGGEIRMSPMMEFSNPEGQFVGENAAKANSFLKRKIPRTLRRPRDRSESFLSTHLDSQSISVTTGRLGFVGRIYRMNNRKRST